MTICQGDSCIIAGSQQAMERYVKEVTETPPQGLTIKKTRFGEIMTGIRQGAPYSFDDEAYKRFLPLAQQEGLDLPEETPEPKGKGLHLVRVQCFGTR